MKVHTFSSVATFHPEYVLQCPTWSFHYHLITTSLLLLLASSPLWYHHSDHWDINWTTPLRLLPPALLRYYSTDHRDFNRITLIQSSGFTPSTVKVSSAVVSMNFSTTSSGDEAVDTVTGTSHFVLLPALTHTHVCVLHIPHTGVITCTDTYPLCYYLY